MIVTMLRGSKVLSRWLLLAGLLCHSSCQSAPMSFENKTGQNESRPRVFSPRMDYDEWTPLGRGDPLKNNPTFDYVPPVLDRVQYWLDSHTTEPSAKRDILVLGVTAKKTSPKIPEQFLKFVDGPKFTRTSQDASYRNDFTGSTGAEPPKILRTTNFRNGPIDYRNQNRIQAHPASYYPSPYYGQKSKPFTMMLPPPMVQKPDPSTNYGAHKDKILGYAEPTQQFNTQTEEGPILQESQFYALPSKSYNQHVASSLATRTQAAAKIPSKPASQVEIVKSVYTPPAPQYTKSKYEPTTASSVSFEKSNLIYQSTQTLSGGWLANTGSSSTAQEASQATWQTPDYSRDHYDHHAAGSSNHEVVVGQNANIVVDGDTNKETGEVVVGQKEALPSDLASATSTSTIATSTSPSEDDQEETTERSEQKMHIVVANSPSSSADLETHQAKKGPVAVVMPTNYVDKRLNSATSQVPETSSIVPNVSESSTILETSTQRTSRPQPMENPVTGSSTFLEEQPSPPNRMMPPYRQVPYQPAPNRHPASPVHAFGPPQAPLQPMMHPQSRPNHAMMHFIGSMRPSVAFRPPMSHVSPPMAHMHAPPMKPILGMDHQRPPQVQSFAFTNPPSPSTLTEDQSEHHRLPELTTFVTTSSPFLPTVPSTEGSTLDSSEAPTRAPSVKIPNQDKTSKKVPITPPATTAPPQTTTVPSLTTDPIFSHYKQPAKPIRGPMYLIIQGHSKVKTYKPTVNKHGVPVERNEIAESVTEKQLSKFEQFIRENTKNGVDSAERKKQEDKAKAEKRVLPRQESLMSIVESGVGSFTLASSSSSVTERQAGSTTTVQGN
ncbi:hypothetical protein KM043_002595 [Ampulex compressa]|nr:hypothetical protein KM043_002595 [Ampulex compressa]